MRVFTKFRPGPLCYRVFNVREHNVLYTVDRIISAVSNLNAFHRVPFRRALLQGVNFDMIPLFFIN